LDNQRKIDETLKFIKENEEHLTEEQVYLVSDLELQNFNFRTNENRRKKLG
jgi:hypothetical protein